jgi:Fe-S-cluster-containing hydrogenase component 2
VDHNACILCDRCIRACDVVKDNHVIGRMLKGYQARIAFDLDAPMGFSSCVSCGECMTSCPTGALTFRRTVSSGLFEDRDPPAVPIDISEELPGLHPEIQRALERVSPTFLDFNRGAIARRHFAAGQEICRQGEYGSTAFFLEAGTADIVLEKAGEKAGSGNGQRARLWGWMRRPSESRSDPSRQARRNPIPVDAPVLLAPERPQATLVEGDLFGEMACMNGYPRSATVRAGAAGCTVLEMQRNVLDMIRRSRSYREMMERKYRERLVKTLLASVPLLSGLDGALIDELSKSVGYRRCEPGEVILRQGAPAISGRDPLADGMFLVRSGFVRVGVDRPGDQTVVNYLGPGSYFGEIGLLTGLPAEALTAHAREPEPELGRIRQLVAAGVRLATCTALDHVELVQLAPEDFLRVFSALPQKVRHTLVHEALERVRQAHPDLAARGAAGAAAVDLDAASVRATRLREFLDQGLMGAQSLLVLDLLKCTRCDECTKACSDTHGGVTRLIREGLRFDRFLVTSSCRSCHDPVCLVGCPVDAIHRRPGSNEIWIGDNCIGCGKCAENCPYGNINMHTVRPASDELVAIPRRATTCDQCHSLPGHQPNCVVACPHDAAHRMQGAELWNLVEAARDF